MSNIGTPDGQRGVVNAQKLLASFASTDNNETVALPSNSESLILIADSNVTTGVLASVVGVTTGIHYPFISLLESTASNIGAVFLVFVSPAADSEVTINWTTVPSSGWAVIADAGVRFTSVNAIITSQASRIVNGVSFLSGVGNGNKISSAFGPIYLYGFAAQVAAADSVQLYSGSTGSVFEVALYCSAANQWFYNWLPEPLLWTDANIWYRAANINQNANIALYTGTSA